MQPGRPSHLHVSPCEHAISCKKPAAAAYCRWQRRSPVPRGPMHSWHQQSTKKSAATSNRSTTALADVGQGLSPPQCSTQCKQHRKHDVLELTALVAQFSHHPPTLSTELPKHRLSCCSAGSPASPSRASPHDTITPHQSNRHEVNRPCTLPRPVESRNPPHQLDWISPSLSRAITLTAAPGEIGRGIRPHAHAVQSTQDYGVHTMTANGRAC
jgi:hypothetical protein